MGWQGGPAAWVCPPLKINLHPCNPASSVISTPFKPPPSVFPLSLSLSHCPPLPSHLFHLTPDGALSLNAVGSRGPTFTLCVWVSKCCISFWPAPWDSCCFPTIRNYLVQLCSFFVILWEWGQQTLFPTQTHSYLHWTPGEWCCGCLL